MLKLSLQGYGSLRDTDSELILVEDAGIEDRPDFDLLTRTFRSVRYLQVDKTKSKLPVTGNPIPLFQNIAVRKARHDCCFLSHPECLQYGTIERIPVLFSRNRMVFFRTWKTHKSVWTILNGKQPKITDIIISTHSERCAMVGTGVHITPELWPYGWLFSREDYLDVGGYEESTMQDWGCEDDIFASACMNAGIEMGIDHVGRVVHLWHPSAHEGVADDDVLWEAYQRNQQRCATWDLNGRMKLNTNHDWGSFDAIAVEEVYERKSQWLN